jgi:acetoin utilization deacetylase AcuC-like enzyme
MIPLVTHPSYSFSFPSKHRFPMEKFQLLHTYLKETGIATSANTFRPGIAKPELLQLAHCPSYLERLTTNQLDKQESRRLGLPWSEELIKRTLISPNGSFLAANLAMEHGIACHLAGGTHHAHYNTRATAPPPYSSTSLALLPAQCIAKRTSLPARLKATGI